MHHPLFIHFCPHYHFPFKVSSCKRKFWFKNRPGGWRNGSAKSTNCPCREPSAMGMSQLSVTPAAENWVDSSLCGCLCSHACTHTERCRCLRPLWVPVLPCTHPHRDMQAYNNSKVVKIKSLNNSGKHHELMLSLNIMKWSFLQLQLGWL